MLLIVESPSKCSKIESFLSCKCISSKGHLRELKVLPKPGENPVFDIIDEKKTHIETMRKVIKNYVVRDIYIATDDDREGEAIAWHICQVFGLPVDTVKRIIFHEVTKAALEKAVSTPGLINMALVRAQQARQVLDLTVGYRVSPILWKYLYRNRESSLSAGRCQTPALRLVYDNYKEKKEITQTYKVGGLFFPKKILFELTKEFDSQKDVMTFLESSKGFRYELLKEKLVKKEVVEGAPRPFHTSGLLQAASSQLRMSPKEVICQRVSAEVAIHGKKTHFTEASLIKKLEDIGIGRPSTFASLVDTIIERGYVKKGDIEGTNLSIMEYVLEGDSIIEKAVEKKVGGEKGKLVIQPVGITVAEFLTEHFGSLFAYDYTREMELDLDKIATNTEGSKDICKNCNDEIERLIQPVEKRRFVIKDSSDVVVFGRYGLMIQSGGSKNCRSVKEGIDMGRLSRGEYTLDELVEKKESRGIGEYLGSAVSVAKGPFGWYVAYKEMKMGCKTLLTGVSDEDAQNKKTVVEEEPNDEEVYNAFVKYMETKDTPKDGVAGMIRELTPELSIRNGKYGGYIFYKTPSMKKPKFFSLKGFKESYRFCQKDVLMEWIRTTHQIQGI